MHRLTKSRYLIEYEAKLGLVAKIPFNYVATQDNKKNKARYTATKVGYGWAGAVITTQFFGQEQYYLAHKYTDT